MRSDHDAASRKWYAIRVASNFEKPAAQALRCKGIEEFLPLYSQRRGSNGCFRAVERALFPGYVFGRFDICDRLSVLMTPGVVHIVSAGRTPVPVADEELAAVKRVLDSGLPAEPWPFLRVGERIWIECGPLRGLEGIVVQFKGSCRLVVSVTLLERSVSVEIERQSVRPIPSGSVSVRR
jgi:transcription antitermination factor NusG